jgi:outer membrane protein W
MKKQIIIMLGLIVCGFTIQAQHLYVKTGANYSLQMPSASGMQRVTEVTATTSSFESVDYKLSNGLSPQVTFGYYLNKYSSFEITTGYHFGSKQTVENQIFSATGNYVQSNEMSLNYGFINPCFVVNPGFAKWNPYIGLGAYIGYSNVMTEEITNDNSQYMRRYATSGGSQFGFFGKLGMNYNLNKNWAVFSELSYANASWTPERKHLNAAIDNNGTDVYETIKPYAMLTEYKENYKHNSQGMVDASKTQKRLKSSLPLDYLSLGVGIKFSF